MSKGLIFDIKEFALNDGPGIRLTVFLKGCPLRCQWCHNPEGLLTEPQLNLKTGLVVGKLYSENDLVEKISKFKDVFELSNGGVTFSGGEPTMQGEFLYNVALQLGGIHKTLDTSGYCDSNLFKKLLTVFDLIYFDLKIIDEIDHKYYTGIANNKILDNLKILAESSVPYHIRIPLIPNITDTKVNLLAIKDIILSLKNKPVRVDTLPYNILAGGKYDSYNMVYSLKELLVQNNTEYVKAFKDDLLNLGINIMGDDVKCLQNV